MTHRKQQVESTLKRALAEILVRDLQDPRTGAMISITHVDCSPDMREASVHVSVLPESEQNKAIHGLKHAAGHIHSQLKKKLALKRVPRVNFRLDSSLKRQAEALAAIRRGIEKDQALEEAHGNKQGDSDGQQEPPVDAPEDTSS